MRPQLPHRAVEAGGTAVRARLHHAALHRRRRELGKFAAVKMLGQAQVCLKQALFHRVDLGIEVACERLVDRQVRLVKPSICHPTCA
jgi:hypothetical protein